MDYVISVVLGTIALVFAFLFLTFWQKLVGVRKRFAGIINVETELAAAERKLEQAKQGQKEFERENEQRRTKLIQDCEQLEAKREELKTEVSLLEENLEDISFGFTSRTSVSKLRKSTRPLLRTYVIKSANSFEMARPPFVTRSGQSATAQKKVNE